MSVVVLLVDMHFSRHFPRLAASMNNFIIHYRNIVLKRFNHHHQEEDKFNIINNKRKNLVQYKGLGIGLFKVRRREW